MIPRSEYAKMPLHYTYQEWAMGAEYRDPEIFYAYEVSHDSRDRILMVKKDYSKYQLDRDIHKAASEALVAKLNMYAYEKSPSIIELKARNQPQKENGMNGQLFQIKGTEEYGTIIGTNSQGLTVFEIRGSGAIKTVARDMLEEVLPYTVNVKYLSGSYADDGRTYSFFSKAGEFEVGDMVISGDHATPMIVTKINSKSKAATKELTGAVFRATKVVEKKKED